MDGKADPKDNENIKQNAAKDEIPEHHTKHTEYTKNHLSLIYL